jgi:hypothetical protein
MNEQRHAQNGGTAATFSTRSDFSRGTSPPSQDLVVWIKENQTLAMLGAFAIGVFVGVLMRD